MIPCSNHQLRSSEIVRFSIRTLLAGRNVHLLDPIRIRYHNPRQYSMRRMSKSPYFCRCHLSSSSESYTIVVSNNVIHWDHIYVFVNSNPVFIHIPSWVVLLRKIVEDPAPVRSPSALPSSTLLFPESFEVALFLLWLYIMNSPVAFAMRNVISPRQNMDWKLFLVVQEIECCSLDLMPEASASKLNSWLEFGAAAPSNSDNSLNKMPWFLYGCTIKAWKTLQKWEKI